MGEIHIYLSFYTCSYIVLGLSTRRDHTLPLIFLSARPYLDHPMSLDWFYFTSRPERGPRVVTRVTSQLFNNQQI
jgi:hypothetical protein